MQSGRLWVLVVPEHPDVTVQGANGILALLQFALQLVAVALGIHGVEAIHAASFFLDADLHFVQCVLGLPDVTTDLLSKTLKAVGATKE